MENEKKTERGMNVLIVGTKNPEILKGVTDFANYHEQQLVVLDDKVIDDYMKRQESAAKNEEERLKDFLANKDNRNNAEEKALTLWNLLTQNAPIANSVTRIFTKSEVTNKTNLSHKSLGEALDLFHLFGLVEYVKGNYEFKFTFGKETQAAAILADLSECINEARIHRERYIAALKNCGKTDAEIDAEMLRVGEDMTRLLGL